MTKRAKYRTAEKQIPLFLDPRETVESAGAQSSSTEKSTKRIERRGVASGILVGTAAFAKAGEAGDPYAKAAKPAEYISHYANHFPTVELDTTFYATPTAKTVRGWYEKTPEDFVFAAKVPKVITHDKVLLECEEELTGFVKTMDLLEQKLGPMLLQFGYFNKNAFKCGADFLARLKPFLKKLPKDHKFAVEVRNSDWLDERFVEALAENGTALALTDQSWMPRPWELPESKLDLLTADFAYVRWLGDRKGIEAITKTWDKTVVDRREDLLEWVKIVRGLAKRNLKVYAYANNHYAGNGPGTVKLFWELFERAS